MERDTDSMVALCERMRVASCSDEEFAASLFVQDENGKIAPPRSHSQHVKRHQADVSRRKVLKELVAWWIGMQPKDRPLWEKHRRFYHRFGIDIGNAFTLKASETDALVEKIQKNFAKDMMC